MITRAAYIDHKNKHALNFKEVTNVGYFYVDDLKKECATYFKHQKLHLHMLVKLTTLVALPLNGF
jgi:hypothetical protein